MKKKTFWNSAQRKVKKFMPSIPSRSHSPAGCEYQLDRQNDRSSTSTHTLYASTNDNSASRTTLIGTQAGAPDINDDIDDKKSVPTITVEECPTPLAPISPPTKTFLEVKTTNAQHDLVVLHVAYILKKSSHLQSLVLEIVRLSKNHVVRESSRCSFE